MASIRPVRIAQIAVIVRDLERAKSFYRDKLGLDHLFDAPPGMSFFQCGETRLMLAPPERMKDAGTPIIYYEVEDIEAAHRSLEADGVAVDTKPHFVAKVGDNDLWLAFCRDPDGNMIGLMSYRGVG